MSNFNWQNLPKNWNSFTRRSPSWLMTLLGLALLVFGLGTSIWLLKQQQDLRQRASVDRGLVEISVQPSQLTPNQKNTLSFFINTNGLQIDGVQIEFSVTGVADFDEKQLKYPSPEQMNLRSASQKVTKQNKQAKVSLLLLDAPNTFASNDPKLLFQLELEPNTDEQVKLSFDNVNSLVTVRGDDGVSDQLRQLADISLAVEGSTNASDTDSSDTSSDNPAETSTADTATSNQDSVSSTTSNQTKTTTTDTSSTTDTNNQALSDNTADRNEVVEVYSGVGGTKTVSLSACNEYCADSTECEIGLGCYYNRCRLLSNPSNTSCQAYVAAASPSSTTSNSDSPATSSDRTNNTTQANTASPTPNSNAIANNFGGTTGSITPIKSASPSPLASAQPAAKLNAASPVSSPLANPSADESKSLVSRYASKIAIGLAGLFGLTALISIGWWLWQQKSKISFPERPIENSTNITQNQSYLPTKEQQSPDNL